MRTDPAAILFRLTAAQISMIWPGLDLIFKAYVTWREKKPVLYAYPFRLYPPPAGFDQGVFDEQTMDHVIALWTALRPKATVGGRVQMNCIQIRAAIFAIRSNLGLWGRRKYDERRLPPETRKRAGISNVKLHKLHAKSQRVIRSLERHMKRANRLLQSLVSPEDYAAFMDAWKKHLRWMRLHLVYFKSLRRPILSWKRRHQYTLNRLGEIAERGLRGMGYQPPNTKDMRKMVRLYAQYARRGREGNFTVRFLVENEKQFSSADHMANFVLRRLKLESLPQL